MNKLVYLLEDDLSICELIKCSLELCDVDLVYANSVKDFFELLNKRMPDLILLDIMLPDGNGLDVLKKIKSGGNTPVIMLSALGQETDKVKGLNLGAEDYISKPFGVLELNARVNVALRRNSLKACFVSGLEIDSDSMTVKLLGQTLELNPKEYKLLTYLIANEGKVISRDRLLDAVWGYDYGGETRTVDNHIARLRKLGLEDNLVTVFGVGYKFISKS